MVDEGTFLEALKDAPTNDPLWLIYADWLEERGDPRSQEIRLLCKEGRSPAPDPPPPRMTYFCSRGQMMGRSRPAGWGTLVFGVILGTWLGSISELKNPGITNVVPFACAYAAALAGLFALFGLCLGFGSSRHMNWCARLGITLAGPILGGAIGTLVGALIGATTGLVVDVAGTLLIWTIGGWNSWETKGALVGLVAGAIYALLSIWSDRRRRRRFEESFALPFHPRMKNTPAPPRAASGATGGM